MDGFNNEKNEFSPDLTYDFCGTYTIDKAQRTVVYTR